MHIQRLTAIAQWLEAGAPEKAGVSRFHMTRYIVQDHQHCGTRCCIAGAAIQFDRAEKGERPYRHETEITGVNTYDCTAVVTVAARILDLPFNTAAKLFVGENTHHSPGAMLSDVTPAWAARCIRKLMATGEVDWSGTEQAI
jgi:hypothetical protein